MKGTMFSKKKKKPLISAPTNFEHRVHTGFDRKEGKSSDSFCTLIFTFDLTGKFVGLPPQWLSLIQGGGGNANRPKPIIDPSNITPTEIMDIKSHTIVRGHNSSTSMANNSFVAPNRDVMSTKNLVTRSNSLRRVESPSSQMMPHSHLNTLKNTNLNRTNNNIGPPETMDLLNGNSGSHSNFNPNPQMNMRLFGSAGNTSTVNNTVPMSQQPPQIMNHMNANMRPPMGNYYPQPPPHQQPTQQFNAAQNALMANKARYGMLPQAQPSQFVPNSQMMMMQGNANPMVNRMNDFHHQQNQFRPQLAQQNQQMSPNQYSSMQMNNGNGSSNPMVHSNQEDQMMNNQNLLKNNHNNAAIKQQMQLNQNMSSLSIKPMMNGQQAQSQMNHQQMSPSDMNGNIHHLGQNHQVSPSNNSVGNMNHAMDLSQGKQPGSSVDTNGNHQFMHSKTPSIPDNKTSSNFSAHHNGMQGQTNGSNNVSQPTTNVPQVPAHAQQRVTHEQFRAALQMVVSQGDPR